MTAPGASAMYEEATFLIALLPPSESTVEVLRTMYYNLAEMSSIFFVKLLKPLRRKVRGEEISEAFALRAPAEKSP